MSWPLGVQEELKPLLLECGEMVCRVGLTNFYSVGIALNADGAN